MPEITVIVTVHNAEKFLKESMESVLEQSFEDLEILCIDGGSTDATPEILKSYAQTDDRVHIINDLNTSYGHKVNVGIDKANGKYISVLESDDIYEPYMLEKLYNIAEQYQVDFVNGNYKEFFDINGERFYTLHRMYEDSAYNTIIENSKCPERKDIWTINRYWTGLFRKDFLERNKIRMNESAGASFQDMSFRFLTSALADSAYHIDVPVYRYRIDNPGSSMHDSTKSIVIADEHAFLKEELMKRNIQNQYIWYEAYLWKYRDFLGNMSSFLKGKYREELFCRYRKELEADKQALKKYEKLGFTDDVDVMVNGTLEDVRKLVDKKTREWDRKQEQFFCVFKSLADCKDQERNIVIFGCGKRGKATLQKLHLYEQNASCFIDNAANLQYTSIQGYEVLPPIEAVKKYPNALYFIANKDHSEELAEQLRQYGIRDEKIVSFWQGNVGNEALE